MRIAPRRLRSASGPRGKDFGIDGGEGGHREPSNEIARRRPRSCGKPVFSQETSSRERRELRRGAGRPSARRQVQRRAARLGAAARRRRPSGSSFPRRAGTRRRASGLPAGRGSPSRPTSGGRAARRAPNSFSFAVLVGVDRPRGRRAPPRRRGRRPSRVPVPDGMGDDGEPARLADRGDRLLERPLRFRRRRPACPARGTCRTPPRASSRSPSRPSRARCAGGRTRRATTARISAMSSGIPSVASFSTIASPRVSRSSRNTASPPSAPAPPDRGRGRGRGRRRRRTASRARSPSP